VPWDVLVKAVQWSGKNQQHNPNSALWQDKAWAEFVNAFCTSGSSDLEVVYKVHIQCHEDAKLIKLFPEISFQEQFENDSRLEGLIKMPDLKINLVLIPLSNSIVKQQWPYASAKQWSYACRSDICFMSSTFAVKTTCKISKVEGAQVAAANGKLMMCDIACSNCSSSIQGHNFTSGVRWPNGPGGPLGLGVGIRSSP
jgi:hypothetical protein